MTAIEAQPMPRCCPRHRSWHEIADHLARAFPDLSPAEIRGELGRARGAVERFGLEADAQLDVGERIARHQMMLRAGQVPDNSRLDPEAHAVRRNQRIEASSDLGHQR